MKISNYVKNASKLGLSVSLEEVDRLFYKEIDQLKRELIHQIHGCFIDVFKHKLTDGTVNISITESEAEQLANSVKNDMMCRWEFPYPY
jgi:hypothetical protein